MSSESKSPTPTPEQQAYKKTVSEKCIKRYHDEKIPRSDHHTFMIDCFKENGITKAVRAKPSPAPPEPPGKSSK